MSDCTNIPLQICSTELPLVGKCSSFSNNNVNATRIGTLRRFLNSGFMSNRGKLLSLQRMISKAVESGQPSEIQLAEEKNVVVLDFRALEVYLKKSNSVVQSDNDWLHTSGGSPTLSGVVSPSPIGSTDEDVEKSTSLALRLQPSDEFDWLSRDRFGKILSMSEACDVLNILKECPNLTESLQEFYINTRRDTYQIGSMIDIPALTKETFGRMQTIHKLVLRGMADDDMLEKLGNVAANLQHLDISGSIFVTDAGMRRLFFKNVKESQSALYMIASWVQKNKETTAVFNTLRYLDFSWTSTTVASRNMVALLPGCFLFKRVFTREDDESHGHHIFIRKQPTITKEILKQGHKDETKFEADLQPFTGPKGVKHFLKFIQGHPWVGCTLHVYTEESDQNNNVNMSSDEELLLLVAHNCGAVVVPSHNEKRIYGTVLFQDGNLVELYSIFPINLNHIGEACPKLRAFRGSLRGSWKMKCSLLCELTELDTFSDPITIVSIFESCPNLKKVRIRVVRSHLSDDHMIKCIPTSMCKRNLQELWIAPGCYKKPITDNAEAELGVDSDKSRMVVKAIKNTMNLPEAMPSSVSDFYEIEDLVQLSINSVRTLISECKLLRRLGDIATWSLVTDSDLSQLTDNLKQEGSEVALLCENVFVSNYGGSGTTSFAPTASPSVESLFRCHQ